MTVTGDVTQPRRKSWTTVRVYSFAAAGLAFLLILGLSIRGSIAKPTSGTRLTTAVTAGAVPEAMHPPAALGQGIGLPKQNPPEVAAKAAKEVLQKLKSDPNNFELLAQAGNIYLRSRVFPGAIDYYRQALMAKEDATVRNNYANALFYSGDTDGALQQYEKILSIDPRNSQALFNRGMVRWRGKQDPQGAVTSWKLLLTVNPNEPRRAYIEDMIARASKHAE